MTCIPIRRSFVIAFFSLSCLDITTHSRYLKLEPKCLISFKNLCYPAAMPSQKHSKLLKQGVVSPRAGVIILQSIFREKRRPESADAQRQQSCARNGKRAQAIITSYDDLTERDEKLSTESSSQIDMNHWLYRLIAFIIDSIIIGIIAGIIFSLVIASLFFGGGWVFYSWGWGFYLGFPFLLGLFELLYFVFMEASYGATLGKRLMGLQVQTVNGSKVTFEKAFIRNISKIFWLFLLLD